MDHVEHCTFNITIKFEQTENQVGVRISFVIQIFYQIIFNIEQFSRDFESPILIILLRNIRWAINLVLRNLLSNLSKAYV